jgi:predicted dienelactone hydrolase
MAVVIAVEHPGNNGVDRPTLAGSFLRWDRAEDLKLALATTVADPDLKEHLDPSRVGVAGFSIRGLTTLVAGGARTDPARLISFCRQHPEDGACKPQLEYQVTVGQGEAALADPALAAERASAGSDHSVPGVKAVFAMAPVVQPLTPESLRAMRVPVVIMAGGEDVTVPALTHAGVAKSMIRGATLRVVPCVTHYSFLSTCSAAAKAKLAVCRNAGNQEAAHDLAIRTATSLFDRALR